MVRSRARSASSRSPVIRCNTPAYDANALQQELKVHVDRIGTEKAFDFGLYGSIPVGFAVRAAGFQTL
jgi:hypothetical protein